MSRGFPTNKYKDSTNIKISFKEPSSIPTPPSIPLVASDQFSGIYNRIVDQKGCFT